MHKDSELTVDSKLERFDTAIRIEIYNPKPLHDLLIGELGSDKSLVNVMLPCGDRPIHVAILCNCVGAVKTLLAHGAQVNLRNKQGLSAKSLLVSLHRAYHEWCEEEQIRWQAIWDLIVPESDSNANDSKEIKQDQTRCRGIDRGEGVAAC